jgi:hypothetical protein
MRYVVACTESVFTEMNNPERWVYLIGPEQFNFTYDIFAGKLHEEPLARSLLEDLGSYLKRRRIFDHMRPVSLVSEDEIAVIYIMVA